MKTYRRWWFALVAMGALASVGCGSTDTDAASVCSTFCSQLTTCAATLGSDVATLTGDRSMTDGNCTSLCGARH